MHTTPRTQRLSAGTFTVALKPALLAGAVLLAAAAYLPRAHADSGLCNNGSRCALSPTDRASDPAKLLQDFSAALQISTAGETSLRRAALSTQEYFSFSGVGAIVCTINGKQRMSTAFLVGAFDIGVTVAHTFEENGHWTSPDNCVYTSTDSLGQIRERIPISYIKAQWEAEIGAFGQPAKDLAVIRLSEPSRYAQRTMPLGKFSGVAAPVLMIGFRSDMESDPLKSKSRGTVYERKPNGVTIPSLVGFTHDMDSRGIAAGSPVIDERTGIIIGIHTIGRQTAASKADNPGRKSTLTPRNTMITMNEWLENTLRIEMKAEQEQQEAAAPL